MPTTATSTMSAVGKALKRHPAVAWVTRANSGMARQGYRHIHLCVAGTPDYLGFLRGGRFFGVEVKRTTAERARKRNTDETRQAQDEFAETARQAGALHVVVTSSDEVWAWLDTQ